ncbi:protein RPS10A [Kluyveromyces marxianus]|uniref:Protein RPS10A n=1 Tax=Kluyveromyces marxianus TaxID=4911 RepID=A0ABX6EY06_KLUMA|nr:protein RPS10A [Kluyveromyces marxianus]
MLIPKEDRKKIYQHLFQEGVLVAKKDFNQPKHEEVDTKNLRGGEHCSQPLFYFSY